MSGTYRIVFPIAYGDDKALALRILHVLAEALCAINEDYMATGDYPLLYESGVRYVPERGVEEWVPVPEVLARREGDCDDLACWRVAELRRMGVRARPLISAVRLADGRRLWHMRVVKVVETDDGPIEVLEDPSAILGMPTDTLVEREL